MTIRTVDEILADPYEGREPPPPPDQDEGDHAHAAPMTDQAVSNLPVPAPTMMSAREVQALAEQTVKSAAFRNTPAADAAVKIMLGREMGLSPMLAMQNLYVVHGRATLNSGTIAAMIKKHPSYNYRVTDHDTNQCSVQFYEEINGQWVESGLSTFTMDDAKRAGLVKPNGAWHSYPRNMLFARALTNGARWYCPDVFGGPIYTPDEIEGQFRVIDDGAGGIAAAPDQPESASSAPQQSQQPKHEPTALSRSPWTEEMKAAKVDELRIGETCPLHGVKFFKKGKMKSVAHPPEQQGDPDWCYWIPVNKALMDDVGKLFEQFGITEGSEREQWAVLQFPDLDGVPPKRLRLQDWYAVKEALIAAIEKKGQTYTTEEAIDEETGEVTEVTSLSF